MYSVVLMMALSGGGDVVAWQSTTGPKGRVAVEQTQQMNRCGCRGCRGCHGCYGGCYCGGYGGYCHGCYGGGYYGGCRGYGYGGGYCHGCYGGGYYGCCGGYGGGYYIMPYMPPAGGPPPGGPPPKDGDKPPKTGEEAAAATITVSLPADAKLFVDDNATKSTSSTRTFVSPPLTPGKEFHYTLMAEIMRDGQKLTATERVPVRAGQDATVVLDASRFTGTGVAAK
jgi:uncharacterized protein (TIGR03000 family)